MYQPTNEWILNGNDDYSKFSGNISTYSLDGVLETTETYLNGTGGCNPPIPCTYCPSGPGGGTGGGTHCQSFLECVEDENGNLICYMVEVCTSAKVTGTLRQNCSGSGVVITTYSPIIYLANNMSALGYPLTSTENSFLSNSNNNTITSGLSIYLENNKNQQGTQFVKWAIAFFMQNNDITWAQFKNWFITKSDSQSMEYDNGISDAVFSQQTFQQHSLPKMSDYELAFPSKPNPTYPDYYRDAESNINVYNNYVGGRLKAKFNEGPMNSSNELWNACATRQSYAHNKLGIMIPFQHNDLIGDNNWNYIVKASTMGIFLEKTYGALTYKLIGADANDKNKIAKFLEGKTGIYLSINNDRSLAGFSGHTDMIKNGYVSGGANVTNSNGNIVNGGIKYIYIWEL